MSTKKKLHRTAMSSFLFFAVGITFVGCVSASKHNAEVSALQGEIDKDKGLLQKSQNQLDMNSVEIQTLQAKTLDLEQKLAKNTKDRGQLQSTLEDLKKDRGQLQNSLDEMKKALEEMRARQAEQKKRIKEFQDLTKRFKSLTNAGSISIKMIDGKMVVSLGSDVLFPSGSAKLSSAGVDTIKEVTKQLVNLSDKRYQIEGHTDNVPIATAIFPSNWELASARALTVVKAMIESGMASDRVSAASFGETKPVRTNDTPEGKSANRRIEVVIVPDLSTLPGYDELNKLGAEN